MIIASAVRFRPCDNNSDANDVEEEELGVVEVSGDDEDGLHIAGCTDINSISSGFGR